MAQWDDNGQRYLVRRCALCGLLAGYGDHGAARRGWREINGRWVCPSCLRAVVQAASDA